MAATNMKMIELFGAKWKSKNDVANCPHPCDNERQLFFAPDPEHVAKNIRNAFCEKKLVLPNKQVATLLPVEATLLLEEKNLIPKLSPISASDIYFKNSFAKMKTKPMRDLFSDGTVDALTLTANNLHNVPLDENKKKQLIESLPGTLHLVKCMAKWSSLCFESNALTDESLVTLAEIGEIIYDIEYEGEPNHQPRPYQRGMKMFSNTCSSLQQYMKQHHPNIQLNLLHLNSACIENSFSQAKSLFSHPTAIQFSQPMRWLVLCEFGLKKSRNSSLGETIKLISCSNIFRAAKSLKLSWQMAYTLINIPSSFPFLTSSQINQCNPIINLALEWFSPFTHLCKCLEKVDNRIKQSLEIAYWNLLTYIDCFKATRAMSTFVFSKRTTQSLLSASLLSPCKICNIENNLIHRFVKLCLKYQLEKYQSPTCTDFSSKSAFVNTSINYNKLPSKEAINSILKLTNPPKQQKTPFGKNPTGACKSRQNYSHNKE